MRRHSRPVQQSPALPRRGRDRPLTPAFRQRSGMSEYCKASAQRRGGPVIKGCSPARCRRHSSATFPSSRSPPVAAPWREEEHMVSRKALLAASVLATGALAAAAPGSARNATDAMPAPPAMSCRVAGMTGGQENTEIRYTPDCRPMHSLNVVRKGPLGVPRAYGEVQSPIHGGGHVTGWEGGDEGGPVYAPVN